MSLVVVSNRIAHPQPDAPIEGGLAAALLPIVESSGAIWVGASDRLSESGTKDGFAKIVSVGAGAVAGIDLPREHFSGYYDGYANSALWPLLHSRTDLVRARSEDYACYRAVNAHMARSLLRFVAPNAMIWVHDYHFLLLAAELRALGLKNRIGFFLHTPFPSAPVFASLSNHRELAQAMLNYDLVGFQTDDDRTSFAGYLRSEFGLHCSGDTVTTKDRRTRIASFPIGIDAERFARRSIVAAATPEVARLRSSLQGALLAIGVDRIDYSKGLTNRFLAFDRMLKSHPELRRGVALLQIAVPTRQRIDIYRQLQSDLAGLVGAINGRHSEFDWTPIRYLSRGFSQPTLAGLYRTARVGLVTPYRDGMNLVAKEYVAAQNPHDPGTLVLSRFAGAAKQLDAAMLVDPHDVDALARTMAQAFTMPIEERRERWRAMMGVICKSSLDTWSAEFVDALRSDTRASALELPGATLDEPRLERAGRDVRRAS